jgi:hypothetical protein
MLDKHLYERNIQGKLTAFAELVELLVRLDREAVTCYVSDKLRGPVVIAKC